MTFATDNAGWTGSVARFWKRTYAADYFGFTLLVLTYFLVEFFVEPFHRMFSLDDRSISYPHALIQRVSEGQNLLYGGGVPLACFVIWGLLWRPGFHKVHVTMLGFFISIFLTCLLTDIVKNAVGRPRPDLLDRCKPGVGTSENELVTIQVCTETNRSMLQDGWRSFPSGHSSFAFSGLGYLALFFAGQFHIFRPGTDLARTLIFIAPIIGAAMIAMSRLADYRHDVYDVTAGSLLGMVVAHFSYRRYYKPLRHSNCHEPYQSPGDAVAKRTRDDEHRIARAEEFELAEMEDEEETQPLGSHR